MEGYFSIEEQMQDYIELFFLLLEPGGEGEELTRKFAAKRSRITQREQLSPVRLPSCQLRDCCMLTETEYLLVMLAAAFELENTLCMEFKKYSGRAWPDYRYAFKLLSAVTDISFDLIMRLKNREGALNAVFFQGEWDGNRSGGILSEPLVLRAFVLGFILNGRPLKQDWYDLWHKEEQTQERKEFLRINEGELRLLQNAVRSGRGITLSITGRKGSGRHALIRRCCGMEELAACFIKLDSIAAREKQEKERSYSDIRLLWLLFHPVFVIETGKVKDETLEEELEKLLSVLSEKAEEWRGFGSGKGGRDEKHIILLSGERENETVTERFADFGMSMGGQLSAGEKREVLDHHIEKEYRRQWQDELFAGYRMNIGEMLEKLKKAEIYIRLHGGEKSDEALYQGAVRERKRTYPFGRIIETEYVLEDLILPKECFRQLTLLIDMAKGWFCMKERQTGLIKRREGLHVLFHGGSGTGKTMAASAVAARLGLPLLKVDLSRLVDKYIGETEKHMDEIFKTAERESCIVFFDEADAVFARRTGIQDSNDRYSNVSTAYLLQRMEDFEGIVILATNLIKNFDEAFLRRIRLVIRFAEPEEEDRLRLWKRLLEGALPVAEDVKPEVLARAVSLSPARIKASVQNACMFAACENSSRLEMRHIVDSLYLEAGKDETAIGMLTKYC